MHPSCDIHVLPYRADPALYFEPLHREPGAVLFDSGRPVADRGRYDILSAWPVLSVQPQEQESGQAFFERLREGMLELGGARLPEGADLPFAGGWMGYLAYEFGRRLESAHESERRDGEFPDAMLGLYDWALITDHAERTSQLVLHPTCDPDKRQRLIRLFESVAGSDAPADAAPSRFALDGNFRPTIDRDTYRRAIERIHDYIRAGDCYQVNYTQRFEAGYRGDPWGAYCALRAACATPFAGYVNLGGDEAILSLSPERFIRLHGRMIETRPIKGTRPRGRTPDEDARNARELCESTKDRAENVMIIDLLRNDIGRSSRIGSVHVPELFSLESYPNVHHLVSCVRAELAEGLDAFDLLAGSFPGGSITGAPKIRAMQIIDELEPHPRSLYCGSLLYVDVRGEMDSSITIRSLLARDGRIRCWGGGGIVMDSDWEEEYQESLDKVGVLLRTLETAAN